MMLTKIEVATISPQDEDGNFYKVMVHRKATLLGKLFGMRPQPEEYYGENMTWYKMPYFEECNVKTCLWLFDYWEKKKHTEIREEQRASRARLEASTKVFEEGIVKRFGTRPCVAGRAWDEPNYIAHERRKLLIHEAVRIEYVSDALFRAVADGDT